MDIPKDEMSVLAESMIRGATSWVSLLSSLDESERVDVAVRILHLIAAALASEDPDCNTVSVGLETWLDETDTIRREESRIELGTERSA